MIFSFLISFLMASPSPVFKNGSLSFKNGAKLNIEIADSMMSRNRGLMNRTSLKKDHGMLFIFGEPQRLSFWMKDTFIPLSIGYFDENKVLKEIHQMKAQNMLERTQDLQNYPSQCQCQFALEVNQGWFKKNKVKVGDKFEFIVKK